MEFEDRLKAAIERGSKRQEDRLQKQAAAALTEAEIKQLHTGLRLKLSEHIETGVKRLLDHFPGFKFETLYGDRGWGAAAVREDLRIERGQRRDEFSRLEITVRPYSSVQVLDLQARGTVRNREVFNRSVHEKAIEADVDRFLELVDNWILEYAELFAAA